MQQQLLLLLQSLYGEALLFSTALQHNWPWGRGIRNGSGRFFTGQLTRASYCAAGGWEFCVLLCLSILLLDAPLEKFLRGCQRDVRVTGTQDWQSFAPDVIPLMRCHPCTDCGIFADTPWGFSCCKGWGANIEYIGPSPKAPGHHQSLV